MIHSRAAGLRDLLEGRLIAATLTPKRDGHLDAGVLSAYLDSLVRDGADALAVAAHTGRGPYLTAAERETVVATAVQTGVPVLVGVQDAAQAEQAAALGADGVMLFPPETDAVGLHEAVWRASGVPVIAFDLYLRPYEPAVLERILALEGVAGLKLARLHDAIACQRGIELARAAGRLAITGEDRMFGASLMWGAQAALVGLAAASVAVTAETLDAWRDKRFDDFVAASERTDALARDTFCEPYDGYVQRMQWIAVAEGRIPPEYGTDPHAPAF